MKSIFARWLAILLIVPPCHPAARADPDPTVLSRAAVTQLSAIASLRPCAATVLLYLRLSPSAAVQSGVMQFEGMPTPGSVALLLDTQGSDRFDSFVVMQRSPYSNADYFVEVQWSVVSLQGQSAVLTTSAQLVDKSGAPLRPRHSMEPGTRILLSDAGIVLLDRPEASL